MPKKMAIRSGSVTKTPVPEDNPEIAELCKGVSKQSSLSEYITSSPHRSLDEGASEMSMKDALKLMLDRICIFEKSSEELRNKIKNLATTEYIDRKFEAVITKQSLKTELAKQNDKIKAELTEIFKDEIDKMHGTVHELTVQLEDMKTQIEQLKMKQKKQLEETELMKAQSQVLRDKQVAIDQYSRRNSVRIFGVTDENLKEQPEETTETVIKLLQAKLNVNLQRSDVDIAHRLGKFRQDGNRPIIVKFVSRLNKQKVIANRRHLKGTSIVIREDLARENQILLETVFRQESVKNAWSKEGAIYALLHSGKTVKIDSKTDLETLEQQTAIVYNSYRSNTL